jgi:hypothetical protein
MDPPLEVVHFPFEGEQIIGYLHLPRGAAGTAPTIMAVNGLDCRKEDSTETFSAILPFGIGYIAVDGPGAGQSPIKAGPTSECMLVAVLDYLATRPEVDKTSIAIRGVG